MKKFVITLIAFNNLSSSENSTTLLKTSEKQNINPYKEINKQFIEKHKNYSFFSIVFYSYVSNLAKNFFSVILCLICLKIIYQLDKIEQIPNKINENYKQKSKNIIFSITIVLICIFLIKNITNPWIKLKKYNLLNTANWFKSTIFFIFSFISLGSIITIFYQLFDKRTEWINSDYNIKENVILSIYIKLILPLSFLLLCVNLIIYGFICFNTKNKIKHLINEYFQDISNKNQSHNNFSNNKNIDNSSSNIDNKNDEQIVYYNNHLDLQQPINNQLNPQQQYYYGQPISSHNINYQRIPVKKPINFHNGQIINPNNQEFRFIY